MVNVTVVNPNITNLVDVIILANNIVGAPFPTFVAFGMVLAIALIVTFSLVQFFKWERAMTAGATIGLLLTLLLSLGGPQLMNIYYSAMFTFFMLAGIWFTIRSKEATV
jgi:hypothetical protein